jgi:spore maturation protein CgeB
MQLGVIGPVEPDSFAENIGDSLTRMGHGVVLLGSARAQYRNHLLLRGATLARQAIPYLEERAQRRLVREALEANCEAVINVDGHLMPDAVMRLKANGVRVAFWFPDSVANLERQLMLLAPYDAVFFKEPQLVNRLRAMLDMPIYYLPEACNPRWHRPVAQPATDACLVLAGQMYPSRVRLLERLILEGIPLRLYGPNFPRWTGETQARTVHTGKYLAREEKARVFRSAVGVLNTLHPSELNGVNVRLFEAAGSGAAVLTEFRPALPDLFDIGEEVLAYRDFDELVSNAKRMFAEDGLAARLGDAAARRAHRDHTYELRLDTILEQTTRT